MPLYEFLCPACGLLETFFSKRPSSAVPRCPHCGGALEREASAFSSGSGVADEADALGGNSIDPVRAGAAADALGAALDRTAARAGEDPRAAARAIREFSEAGGVRFGRGVRELLEDVESGADPEKAGEELERMSDASEDFFSDASGAPGRRAGTGRPEVRRDPEWHDMPEENPEPAPPARKPGPWDA